MRLLIPFVALSLALPPPAVASPYAVHSAMEEPSPQEQEAADAFRKGSKAYEMGNYAEAVRLFERSYELSANADLLFNLGQAYSRWYEIDPDVEHLRKARKLYQNYLTRVEAEGNLTDDVRAETEERIADVERRIDEHERARQRERPTTTDKPVYKKGWFWGTIAGVVVAAGAVTLAVLLTRDRDEGFDPELGTIHGARGPRPLGFRF
jgi:tetratricopeptide (TPR) repeat protein